MKRSSGPLVLALVGLTLFGCSDSSSPRASTQTVASSAAPTITKADYIAHGERICHKYNTEAPAIGGSPQPDKASRVAAQKALINLFHQNIADLRALGYPPGDQPTLDPIYTGVDASLDDLERTLPVDDIEAALGQTLGPWASKLKNYGLDCTQ